MKKGWAILATVLSTAQLFATSHSSVDSRPQAIASPISRIQAPWSAQAPLVIDILGFELAIAYPQSPQAWLNLSQGLISSEQQQQLEEHILSIFTEEIAQNFFFTHESPEIFLVYTQEGGFHVLEIKALASLQEFALAHIMHDSSLDSLIKLNFHYYGNLLPADLHHAYQERLSRQRSILTQQIAPQLLTSLWTILTYIGEQNSYEPQQVLGRIVAIDALVNLTFDTTVLSGIDLTWSDFMQQAVGSMEPLVMAITALNSGLTALNLYNRDYGQSFANLEGDAVSMLISLMHESEQLLATQGQAQVLDFLRFSALQGGASEESADDFATQLLNDSLLPLISLVGDGQWHAKMNELISQPDHNALYQDLLFVIDYLELLSPEDPLGTAALSRLGEHLNDVNDSGSLSATQGVSLLRNLYQSAVMDEHLKQSIKQVLPEEITFDQLSDDEILLPILRQLEIDALDTLIYMINNFNTLELWTSDSMDVVSRYELYLAQLLGMRGLALASVELLIETQAALQDARELESR